MAATKRRQELRHTDSAARGVLQLYTAPLLIYYCQVASVGTIIFYGLFVATVRPNLVVTIPFVLFGLFRYQYIVEVKGKGESPTEVFWSDVPLVLVIFRMGRCRHLRDVTPLRRLLNVHYFCMRFSAVK
ncbi:MAG: hypothetical protein WKF84_20075 [Pyrinomonadaceae bacterium]